MEKKRKKRWFLNKYFWTFVAFAVWMIFFDNNNFVEQKKLKDKLVALQRDTAFYQEETRRFQAMTHSLNSDMETLEKIGREEYRMKRDDETVYLVTKKR